MCPVLTSGRYTGHNATRQVQVSRKKKPSAGGSRLERHDPIRQSRFLSNVTALTAEPQFRGWDRPRRGFPRLPPSPQGSLTHFCRRRQNSDGVVPRVGVTVLVRRGQWACGGRSWYDCAEQYAPSRLQSVSRRVTG